MNHNQTFIMSELSKADKRTCRELIHVALERECKAYADKMAIISKKPVVIYWIKFLFFTTDSCIVE